MRNKIIKQMNLSKEIENEPGSQCLNLISFIKYVHYDVI